MLSRTNTTQEASDSSGASMSKVPIPDEAGTITLSYWPKDMAIPDGWKRHPGLDKTHHGFYSTIIVQSISS